MSKTTMQALASFLLIVILYFGVMFETQAEVVNVSDNGFIVKNQFTSKQSADKIWQALVESVDQWWPKDHSWWGEAGTFSIEAKAGGCFCEIAGGRSAEHMHISFVEPHKLLRMTGGLGPLQGMGVYGALDWSIEESGQGTTVTLTYSVVGNTPEGFQQLAPIVAQVQGLQLNGLKRFVEQ